MRKNIAIGALAAAIILVLAIAVIYISPIGQSALQGNNAEAGLRTVKIGYENSMPYLPLFVALEKDYFREFGLKPELVKFDSSNLMFEALINGQIDATGGGGNTVVIFSLEGKQRGNIKVYSVSFYTEERFMEYLLVKKDSAIDSYADLKGKKIATRPGKLGKTLNALVLNKYLKPEEYEIVEMELSLQLQALEAGGVDALIAYDPVATIGLEKGIAKKIDEGIWAKHIFEPLFISAGTMSAKFLEEEPETAKKFVAAMEKAIDFIDEDFQTAKIYIGRRIGIDEEIAKKANASEFVKLSVLSAPDRQKMQEFADLLYSKKVIDYGVNVADLLIKESELK